MKRRELFKTFAGVVVAGSVAVTSHQRKFGKLTVTGHLHHLRKTGEFLHTFVDGVDVTHNCYEADDMKGYALVFCCDTQQHRDWTAQGRRHLDLDRTDACKMCLTGVVVIAPGAHRA